jgi:F-type H+-transporting ATPase subunit b
MHLMDESFWIAVSFVIFIYFAYKPVKKAIIASLDAKIEEIKKTLAETESLKNDAKLLLDQVKSEALTFEQKQKQMLESANSTISRFTELRSKEMELLLTRIQNGALESIENKKNIASAELRNEFIENVLLTVKAYLKDTKNNQVSDDEIIDHLIKKI